MSSIKIEMKDSFDLITKNHKDPGFCRICLAVKKRLTPLMTQLETEKLIQVFTSATGIDIPTNDVLPQQICFHCKKILLELHIFKQKCVQSDQILKTVILNKIKEEQKDTSHLIQRCDNTSEVQNGDNDFGSYDDTKPEGEQMDIEFPKLEAHLQLLRDPATSQVQSAPTASTTNTDTKHIISNNKDDESIENTEEQLLIIPLKEVVQLKEDQQYMQERKLHSCTECEQSFRSAKSLRIHIKVQHSVNSSLFCGQCQEGFESEKDLKLHSSLHDVGPPWQCVECDKQFIVKYKFRRHTLRHMDSKLHKCEQCDKAFSEHYALVRHSRSHSTCPQPRKYACHLCDKRYLQSSALKAHVSSHSAARPCVCARCGRTFPSARLLHSHARTHTHHKPHACDTCQRTFRHASTLCAHRRTHTGERPYVCARCGKSFLQNSNLTTHMRTHTGEKPYKCSMCPKAFSARSSLTIHERRHTGHKPYVCKICGKGFVGADIVVHMRRHTGTRTHACATCPRQFYTRAALTAHHNVHAGIKPFECDLCQKKMATKSHLVKHLKAHETKIQKTKQQAVNNKIAEVVPYCIEEVVIPEDDTKIMAENQDTYILTIVNEGSPLTGDKTSILEENCLNSNINEAVSLVEVSEDHVSLATAVNSDGFSVLKLYQVDQSLVQISSSGDQVSISTITSTLTANFE